jgi:hypothetical protein
MANLVKDFLQADPSFAGAGAYYNQTPMKVFMGNEPAVPAVVVAAALDQLQGGMATPSQAGATKAALMPDAMQAACMAQAQATCAKIQGAGGAADMQKQQCMQKAAMMCAAVGGKAAGAKM